jgi:hypothetical protein
MMKSMIVSYFRFPPFHPLCDSLSHERITTALAGKGQPSPTSHLRRGGAVLFRRRLAG